MLSGSKQNVIHTYGVNYIMLQIVKKTDNIFAVWFWFHDGLGNYHLSQSASIQVLV